MAIPMDGKAVQLGGQGCLCGTLRACHARLPAGMTKNVEKDGIRGDAALCGVGDAHQQVSNATQMPRNPPYTPPLTRPDGHTCGASQRLVAWVCQLTPIWMHLRVAEYFAQCLGILTIELKHSTTFSELYSHEGFDGKSS